MSEKPIVGPFFKPKFLNKRKYELFCLAADFNIDYTFQYIFIDILGTNQCRIIYCIPQHRHPSDHRKNNK